MDTDLRVPLYHRIFLVLRERIADGTWQPGDLIPGEQELAASFGVSRITTRRAVEELAAARLVRREQGRGTRVVEGRAGEAHAGSLDGMMASNRIIGRTAVRVLAFNYVDPTPGVAQALGLEPGTGVQRSVRLRSFGRDPFCLVTAFVPAELGRTFRERELARRPLIALLERAGVVIGGAEEAVSATLAGPDSAPPLGVEVGAPLIKVTRTVHDISERAVEHFVALFRPDRYQVRLSLRRRSGADAGAADADLFRITA